MEHRSEAEQIARTESLFREVNERIAEGAARFESSDASFVCECGDPACTKRVEATLSEYEQVRADATAFLIAPGHDDRRIETSVESDDHRAVVKKRHPVAAAVVRRLDPRTAGGS